MTPSTAANASPSMVLGARTAADLMTSRLVSLHDAATLPEAVALLIDRGIHAAPVIDEAGHPKGVLSATDLLVHAREQASGPAGATPPADRMKVRDVMTPAVFSVPLDASAADVVREMLDLRVHRLFVVDGAGVLVGVISAFDILRHLQ